MVSLQIIFLAQGAVYHTWHLVKEFHGCPSWWLWVCWQEPTKPNPFPPANATSPTKAHCSRCYSRDNREKGCARRTGDMYSMGWGKSRQFLCLSSHDKIHTKILLQREEGKENCWQSYGAQALQIWGLWGKIKKIIVLCFSFVPLKRHDLFSPKVFSKSFLFPKKDKDISTDNSVGSSSLSHQQNWLHI